jgi:hypothetical protein
MFLVGIMRAKCAKKQSWDAEEEEKANIPAP